MIENRFARWPKKHKRTGCEAPGRPTSPVLVLPAGTFDLVLTRIVPSGNPDYSRLEYSPRAAPDEVGVVIRVWNTASNTRVFEPPPLAEAREEPLETGGTVFKFRQGVSVINL